MRTLVHLSDIHFGRVDYAVVEVLIEHVAQLKPDLVVVSGDLTQRARIEQFKEARRFSTSLPSPQIVVPGNHDVLLDDVLSRFARPLSRYRRLHYGGPSHSMPMMKLQSSALTPHVLSRSRADGSTSLRSPGRGHDCVCWVMPSRRLS